MSNNSLSIGTRLCNGRYIIENVIGAGSFGITYKVRDTYQNNCCAIKEFFISDYCRRDSCRQIISPFNLEDGMFEKFRNRFFEEGRLLEKLNHPNIVKVSQVFSENNTAYIVMNYIEGLTLKDIIKTNGRLSYPNAINYISQLAEAVAYVHQKGFLHRDIKPSNIMITPVNNLVLIDFGAAREFVHDAIQQHTVILTHGYAPLEQYEAKSRKGKYSDIYSMGSVLYFITTGQAVPAATSRMQKDSLIEPRRLAHDISENTNRTILKSLQLLPQNRYQTVQEFMNDIHGHKQPPPPQSLPPKSTLTGQKITIGRGTYNDIVVKDEKVSRSHLQIIYDENGNYILNDLGSLNGTYINDKRTTGKTFITADDTVRIGDTTLPWMSYFFKGKQPATTKTPIHLKQTQKTTGFFKRMWQKMTM